MNLKLSLMLLAGGIFAEMAGQSGKPAIQAAPLMAKDLPGIDGKEAMMLTIELAPGAVSPPHRHNASVFVYVLEGSIVMGVQGGKEVTLGPGGVFHEKPDDIHTVSRNASATKPAKFLVFLVKAKGAAVSEPVHGAH